MEDLTANLEAQFKNEIVRLTHYAQAVQSTATLFRNFYADVSNEGNRMIETSVQLEANQQRLTGSNILKVAGTIDIGLIAPISKFRQTLVSAKEEVRVRCEAKERYEHYMTKLAELKQEHDKTIAKGKAIAIKDIERLKRNEIKYEKSKAVFEAMNVRVIAVLQHLYSTRFMHLDPVFQTYVDLQHMLHEKLSKEANSVRALLQVALEKRPVSVALSSSSVPPLPDIAAIEASITSANGTLSSSSSSSNGGSGGGNHVKEGREGKWETLHEPASGEGLDGEGDGSTLVVSRGKYRSDGGDDDVDDDDIVPAPSR